ncbi:MAG: peptidylprolyl isomerase [Caulobacteraceae bacterium]
MGSIVRDARLAAAAAAVGLACAFAQPVLAQDAGDTAATATAPAPADSGPAPLTDDVVAHVNDDVITNYDIMQRLRLLIVTAGIQPSRDDLPQLEQYALTSLIYEHLEMQELKRVAKEQKITLIASDSVIDDDIADMAKDAHMTSDQFLASLAQRGIAPATLRSQLRAQDSWRDYIGGRYGSQVQVGPDEVKAFQARMAAEASKPKYHISEIFIDAERAGGMQQAMDEANQLVSQLHQGAQFASVARQFSASATAANGGDAGWVTPGELDPEVRTAVEAMRPGALSAPIEVKDGVYIVFLRERQAGGSAVLVSLKQAAIALPADAPKSQVDAARAKLEALRAKLHGCDDFVAVAGKTDGVVAGDLGEAEAKDLAPAFREAATNLAVGQISEPIRSDEGLHIVAVCGRRSNAAQGLDVAQIKRRLMGEQLEMIAKRYIRDLQNSASIEVRQGPTGS